jgi:hypothetical protein
VLTSITNLKLHNVLMSGPDDSQAFSSALCMLLEQLPQLEDLSLPGMLYPGSGLGSVVQHFTSLSQLHSARLELPRGARWEDELFPDLPAGLRQLHVQD